MKRRKGEKENGEKENGKRKNSNFVLSVLLFSLLLSSLFGCKPKPSSVDSGESDFTQIEDSRQINVLTLFGSMSYFIYKNEEMGYQYELIKSFTDTYDLKLNLIVAENETQLIEMFEQGIGDLIAYNIPITNERKEKFLYCGGEIINEQVIIQRSENGDTILTDVPELIGKEVWVIRDSKYHTRLENLNAELGGGIITHVVEKDSISIEDLIERVSEGTIPYTVSDSDMAALNKTYYSNINTALKISHPQRSAWMVRKNMPILAETISDWFNKNANTPKYRSITKRYFEISKLSEDDLLPPVGRNELSPYDAYFKEYALQIGWDWRLLVSIAYLESKFHTNKVSWAGATGLMGLMPSTAAAFDLTPQEMTEPKPSIRAASQFIKRLDKSFVSVEDKNERIKFILAAYNAGAGHIRDAMALAEKHGKNPHVWENNVEEYLRLKHLPEYYNDPVCKQGYFRGNETLRYVKMAIERWEYYKRKTKKL
jgi:membrane-bound lytic murein transglycosylase F